MQTYRDLSQRVAGLSPYLLSMLRIMLALLFIEHGSMKLFDFPHSEMFQGLQIGSLEGVAGMMEFFLGGILMLLGLFTRPAAFLMSGLMAAAYFMFTHPKASFPPLIWVRMQLSIRSCSCFSPLQAAAPGASIGCSSVRSVTTTGRAVSRILRNRSRLVRSSNKEFWRLVLRG